MSTLPYQADCRLCVYKGAPCKPSHDPAYVPTPVTVLAVVTLVNMGSAPMQVQARLVYPDETVENVTLYDHDWTHDWSRDGRAPASLYRHLTRKGWVLPHGERKVYESPRLDDDGPNSAGLVTIWEIDYDRA